jgi:hypothetical protein
MPIDIPRFGFYRICLNLKIWNRLMGRFEYTPVDSRWGMWVDYINLVGITRIYPTPLLAEPGVQPTCTRELVGHSLLMLLAIDTLAHLSAPASSGR